MLAYDTANGNPTAYAPFPEILLVLTFFPIIGAGPFVGRDHCSIEPPVLYQWYTDLNMVRIHR